MPGELRSDSGFQRRNVWRYVICIAGGAGLSRCGPYENGPMRVIEAGVGIAAGYFLGMGLERLAVRFYRCPQCGARIGMPVGEFRGGDAVILPCEACGIDWDVSVTAPMERRPRGRSPGDWD